jgi:hypothetical protein
MVVDTNSNSIQSIGERGGRRPSSVSLLHSSLASSNVLVESTPMLPSGADMAQTESLRQEHKQELQRWQMRHSNEKAELRRQLEQQASPSQFMIIT